MSRRDDERVADILDAASEIGEITGLGIIGLRVVLAHHYHRVDPNQVWVIAATEVPRLVQDIRPAG